MGRCPTATPFKCSGMAFKSVRKTHLLKALLIHSSHWNTEAFEFTEAGVGGLGRPATGQKRTLRVARLWGTAGRAWFGLPWSSVKSAKLGLGWIGGNTQSRHSVLSTSRINRWQPRQRDRDATPASEGMQR